MENVDISTFLHFALQQRFATSSIYVAGKFPNNCKTKLFEAPQIICLLDTFTASRKHAYIILTPLNHTFI